MITALIITVIKYIVFNMTQNSYRKINLDADIKTSWSIAFDGGYLIQDINDVDVTLNNATLFLPAVDIVNSGQSVVLNNVSALDFNVSTSTSTLLTQIKAGEVFEFYLYDNTVAGGLWRIIPYGGGTNNINNIVLESSDNSIVIIDGNVTPPGGTVNFQLTESLSNLNNVNTEGIVVITGKSPLTWTAREIIGYDNIIVTDGDGINNNPIIKLNNVLGNINSALIGGITIAGNAIDSNNNDLTLDTGTANLIINNDVTVKGDIVIDGASTTNGNATFNGTVTITGTLEAPNVIRAACRFTDTLTPPGNTIVIVNKTPNISSVTGSNGKYAINFSPHLSSINYIPMACVFTDGSSLPEVRNIFPVVCDVDQMTVTITDNTGQLVTSIPQGASIYIVE